MEMYVKPQQSLPGSGHYAYGWFLGQETIGNSTDSVYTISHGGGINGFNTTISRAPSDQSLVVLLNNTGGAPLGDITQAIRGILNDKSYDLPKQSLAYDLLDVIQKKGIDAAVAHFQAVKGSDDYDLSEGEMNQVGYQLLRSNKAEEAAQVFKLNIEQFPASANAYDSYGEALMNLGKDDLAIKNYKKSVELNPGNEGGIAMLKKLGVNTDGLTKELVISDDILNSYVGKYELMPGFVLTISKEGTQMKAQATGQQMLDIFPKSEKVFYLKAVVAQITFNEGKDGKIESLTLLQGGQELTGKRMAD